MSEFNKVLFIINRFSGTGFRNGLEGKFISHCNKRNLEGTIEFTSKQGHATTLARMAVKKKYSLVFAVGGDGTVNEVAQGLLNSETALAIIPKGSGNGLARHLGVPMQLDKALDLIDSKEILAIDSFTINEKFSINVSGIGFDGHVAGLFGKDGKRGVYSYGKLVAKQFAKFEDFNCNIQTDHESIKERAFIVSIANSSQFGNNAVIAPMASVTDQLLNVSVVKKMNVVQGIGFVTRLFNNSVDKSVHTKIYQSGNIDISTDVEVPYHADGEFGGKASNFRIRVNPSSLKVAIPPGKVMV